MALQAGYCVHSSVSPEAHIGCRFEPDLGNSRAEGHRVPWNGTRAYGVGVGFALLLALEDLQGGRGRRHSSLSCFQWL